MSKIRAVVKTVQEWHVDDKGLIDEFAMDFDVDQIDLDYYACSDCNGEFETWLEAEKHTNEVCPEGVYIKSIQ